VQPTLCHRESFLCATDRHRESLLCSADRHRESFLRATERASSVQQKLLAQRELRLCKRSYWHRESFVCAREATGTERASSVQEKLLAQRELPPCNRPAHWQRELPPCHRESPLCRRFPDASLRVSPSPLHASPAVPGPEHSRSRLPSDSRLAFSPVCRATLVVPGGACSRLPLGSRLVSERP
jgi:hypothetical protein